MLKTEIIYLETFFGVTFSSSLVSSASKEEEGRGGKEKVGKSGRFVFVAHAAFTEKKGRNILLFLLSQMLDYIATRKIS